MAASPHLSNSQPVTIPVVLPGTLQQRRLTDSHLRQRNPRLGFEMMKTALQSRSRQNPWARVGGSLTLSRSPGFALVQLVRADLPAWGSSRRRKYVKTHNNCG
jgi:hypothetical protein